MFCKFCGTQMNDGDLFCPNCGKQQISESGSASSAGTGSAAQQATSTTQTAQPQAQTQPTAQPQLQATQYVAKKSNAGVIGAVVGVVVVAAVLLGYMFVIKPQQEAKRIAETQQKVAEFLRSVGQNEHANAIIKYGINAKDGSGWTALKVAARNNSRDVAQLLINAKADINAKDNDGYTALIVAVGNNSRDVVQLLINAKADINARDNNGYTALAYAQDAQMQQLLRNAGATY